MAQVRGAECVVMAGDPLQLPTTVLSQRAATEFRLDETLFDRLIANGARHTPVIGVLGVLLLLATWIESIHRCIEVSQ